MCNSKSTVRPSWRLALAVLFLAAAMGCEAKRIFSSNTPVMNVAGEYLRRIGERQWEEAYSMMGPGYRSNWDSSDLKQHFQLAKGAALDIPFSARDQ